MKEKGIFLQCLIQLHPHLLLAAPRAAHKHTIHMKKRKVRKMFSHFCPQQKSMKKLLLWLGARRALHIF